MSGTIGVAAYIDSLTRRAKAAEAERDRLRTELSEAMCAGQSMEGRYHDAADELDRLRAVADAVARDLCGPFESVGWVRAMGNTLKAALDVSPAMSVVVRSETDAELAADLDETPDE